MAESYLPLLIYPDLLWPVMIGLGFAVLLIIVGELAGTASGGE